MKIFEITTDKIEPLPKLKDLENLKKLDKLPKSSQREMDNLVVGPFRPDDHQIKVYRGWDGKPVDPTKVLFIGPNAKGYDKEKANLARQMYKSGQYDRREIWKKTQTILGPDGVFRQEISDHASFMTSKKPGTYKLKDLFKHPTLYKNYPQLKNITVKIFNKPSSTHGYLIPGTNTIGLNTADVSRGDTYEFSKQYIHNVLIHEVQHAIQELEPNMDPGSNTDEVKPNVKKVNKELEKRGINPVFNPHTMYMSVAGEAGARESAYRQMLDDYDRFKNMPNIGRDTDTLTVKGKKIYDVPGDSMPDIQGSGVRGFTYTTGNGQYTTYQNPNVEIDDDTGKPIYTGPFLDVDDKIAPQVQSKTGGPEHDVW